MVCVQAITGTTYGLCICIYIYIIIYVYTYIHNIYIYIILYIYNYILYIECILFGLAMLQCYRSGHVPLAASLVCQEALRCLGCLWCLVGLRHEVNAGYFGFKLAMV